MLLGSASANAQSRDAGQRVFNMCLACHQVGVDAKNQVGPHLNGLFGRPAGSVPGYEYSEAFQAYKQTWSEASFATYIRDPRAVTPGTKMVFAGIRNEQDIKHLAAYLRQFDEGGKPRAK